MLSFEGWCRMVCARRAANDTNDHILFAAHLVQRLPNYCHIWKKVEFFQDVDYEQLVPRSASNLAAQQSFKPLGIDS